MSLPPKLPLRTTRGRAAPLGAAPTAEGINFVLLCRHGEAVSLVVQPVDGDEVIAEIALDKRKHRTGDLWHIQVAGLPSEFRYGWRVNGPAGGGNRFNSSLILLDPSCTAVSDGTSWGANGHHFNSPAGGTHRRSLFFRRPYDWREDVPPLTPLEDSIIYELHVRGFTVHPSSGVAKPGTFAGLAEKIPYLHALGITAVELLPVFEFDEDDCVFRDPATGKRLRNFWGYNSIAFAAPKSAYAASGARVRPGHRVPRHGPRLP